MAKLVAFELMGMGDIQKKLEELGLKPAKVENAALREAAQPIQKEAFEKAPKRTGKGRETIRVGSVRTVKGVKTISVGIHKEERKKGFHMYFQEFGTSRMAARPFLRPAFHKKKEEAFRLIRNSLKEALGL